jgi:hypothetical protein
VRPPEDEHPDRARAEDNGAATQGPWHRLTPVRSAALRCGDAQE